MVKGGIITICKDPNEHVNLPGDEILGEELKLFSLHYLTIFERTQMNVLISLGEELKL